MSCDVINEQRLVHVDVHFVVVAKQGPSMTAGLCNEQQHQELPTDEAHYP